MVSEFLWEVGRSRKLCSSRRFRPRSGVPLRQSGPLVCSGPELFSARCTKKVPFGDAFLYATLVPEQGGGPVSVSGKGRRGN